MARKIHLNNIYPIRPFSPPGNHRYRRVRVIPCSGPYGSGR